MASITLGANSPLTWTVGAGGDFATLNKALAVASSYRPAYVPGGLALTIRLLSGYVEVEGISLVDIDMGYCEIVADDAVVMANVKGDLISGVRAKLPVIRCMFNMSGKGGNGIYLIEADCLVEKGPLGYAGVKKAGMCGAMCLVHSRFAIHGGDFRHAEWDGVYINHASWVQMTDVDLRDANRANNPDWGYGVRVRRVSVAGLSGVKAQIGAVPGPKDIAVIAGGTINLEDCIGGLNQPANVLTANGIIYA